MNAQPLTWFVTGSSRGLGRALVEEALARGDRVAATARNARSLDDLAARFGDAVLPLDLDVTDDAAIDRAVQRTVDWAGGIDVVANNAGYADTGAIEQTSMAAFRTQLETNLFGVIAVTKATLPVLHGRRRGHYLQFSSVGGRVGGTPGVAPYQTAKFGVEGFSEVLANEVAPLGIRVTIVEPGAFRTDWQGSSMARDAAVDPDYEPTVGAWNRRRAETDGHQPGDPARAARILVDLVRRDDPPRRLLLGAGAVEAALRASREREAEAEAWAAVSRSADRPEDER